MAVEGLLKSRIRPFKVPRRQESKTSLRDSLGVPGVHWESQGMPGIPRDSLRTEVP